jgi:hypothetical protein
MDAALEGPAYARLLAMEVLRHLGVQVEGFGCPPE